MSDVKIAVIGSGKWGLNHVKTLYKLGHLAAVCDATSESLEKASQLCDHSVPVYSNYGELIQKGNYNGVVIATPAATHAKIAETFLNLQVPVLVEKPMTMDVSSACSLVDLSVSKKTILMVGHLMDYHPGIDLIQDVIMSGELGKILYIRSVRNNYGTVRNVEDAWWSLAPHDISLFQKFFNCDPCSITLSGLKCFSNKETHDLVTACLKTPCGKGMVIEASWLSPKKEHSIQVVGTKKSAILDDVRKVVEIYNKGFKLAGNQIFLENTPSYKAVSVAKKFPLERELLHFINCIEEGKSPKTDGHWGYRVVKTLAKGSRSLTIGRTVRKK